MVFLGAMALTAMRQDIRPVLWLDLRGNITVNGQEATPRVTPGANRIRTNDGIAYSFNGQHGGILFGDLAPLKLTGSITVSTWIYARSYVNDGPGAQILFRGDDRNGLDPYTLVIHSDGTINFGVSDQQRQGMSVSAELPLNTWVHVTASFNAVNGDLNMWLNDDRVAYARTTKRPFQELERSYTPGLGIGNVQNDRGPHNQPFNGILADVRLYANALSPEEAGYSPASRNQQERPLILARR